MIDVAVSALLVAALRSGQGDGPTTTTTTGAFLVADQDSIASLGSAKPSGGDATSSIQVTGSTKELPPCGDGLSVGACKPVTTCEPDPDSPTGFRDLTSYGYSAYNSDFGLGEPCTPSAAQAARPNLPALVLRAFERVPLPVSALSIQPPKGKTLVGLETIFSTQANGFTRTLTLLGRQVELRVRPCSFTWYHGDGTSQTTDWAGRAWDHDRPDIDGYITHVYEHRGHVRASVEVTWSAEYRVGGRAWRPVDGTVTRQGPAVELVVVEGQPVLNGY